MLRCEFPVPGCAEFVLFSPLKGEIGGFRLDQGVAELTAEKVAPGESLHGKVR